MEGPYPGALVSPTWTVVVWEGASVVPRGAFLNVVRAKKLSQSQLHSMKMPLVDETVCCGHYEPWDVEGSM